MKTLVIRRGERLTIRAISTSTDDTGRDRCATLAFFQEHANLRPKEFEKLSALLTDTAKNGPPPDDNKFKDLPGTDGLHEFKTSGGLRLLCFRDEGNLIICTHGYLKDGQKAPKNELGRAQNLKRDYLLCKQQGTLIHAEPKRQALR